MTRFAARRDAARSALRAAGLGGLLVAHGPNVRYLTGFTGSAGDLVLTDRAAVLVSDSRYEVQLAEECPGLDVHIRPHHVAAPRAVADVLARVGATSIGVEADHIPWALAEFLRGAVGGTTFAPVSGLIEGLRAVKDAGEVEQIRAAVRAAERAFGMFAAFFREGETEKDLADALDGYVRRAGAAGSPFPPIVAADDRGALPHAHPTGRRVAAGGRLLVDWGADLGYKSDLTRTFGPATPARNGGPDFRAVYAAVGRAQAAAAAACRPGVPARDVDAAARAVLAAAGLDQYFTHGLGHGLGLEVHEGPRVRADSDDVLAAGHVFTLEPGVYIPGWGGVRTEDDYLVTADGAVRLSTLPHDPAAIG